MLQSSQLQNGINVLVVDDERESRQLIIETLGLVGNFRILEASNGLEALGILEENPCDLVITDVQMPEMNGVELLTRVLEIDPLIRVIMITGITTLDVCVSAMKFGAVDYLTKPFSISDLIYKVNVYLREKFILSEHKSEIKSDKKIINSVKELSVRDYIFDLVEGAGGSNEQIFQEIVNAAQRIAKADICSFLLFDAEAGKFSPRLTKHNSGPVRIDAVIEASKSILIDAAVNSRPVLLDHFGFPEVPGFIIAVPLHIRKRVFGFLLLFRGKMSINFSGAELKYLESLARRSSLNIENNILYESTYSNIMGILQSLAASIQARDQYTEAHSIRVKTIALAMADAMGCSSYEIESINVAGMLHDIGKIATPDNILLKTGRLDAEEFAIIKKHPETGEAIIRPVLLLDNESHIIRHHHERWDGSGYPDGLAGNDIPLASRVLAVADSFDAMVNNRPYRTAMGVDMALYELRANRWTQFDGNIVDVFLDIKDEIFNPSDRITI
ncbi:MAG: HD domain-containing phosphohydrolase [Syntrophaceae bacterium]